MFYCFSSYAPDIGVCDSEDIARLNCSVLTSAMSSQCHPMQGLQDQVAVEMHLPAGT